MGGNDAETRLAYIEKTKTVLPIGGATVAHSKQCANPAQNVSEIDQNYINCVVKTN